MRLSFAFWIFRRVLFSLARQKCTINSNHCSSGIVPKLLGKVKSIFTPVHYPIWANLSTSTGSQTTRPLLRAHAIHLYLFFTPSQRYVDFSWTDPALSKRIRSIMLEHQMNYEDNIVSRGTRTKHSYHFIVTYPTTTSTRVILIPHKRSFGFWWIDSHSRYCTESYLGLSSSSL